MNKCDDTKYVVKHVRSLTNEPKQSFEQLKDCLHNPSEITFDSVGESILFTFSEWCEMNSHLITSEMIFEVCKYVQKSSKEFDVTRVKQVVLIVLDHLKGKNAMDVLIMLHRIPRLLSHFEMDKHMTDILDTFKLDHLHPKSQVDRKVKIHIVSGFRHAGKSKYIQKHLSHLPLLDTQHVKANIAFDLIQRQQTQNKSSDVMRNMYEKFRQMPSVKRRWQQCFRLRPERLEKSLDGMSKLIQRRKQRGMCWNTYENNPIMRDWCRHLYSVYHLEKKYDTLLPEKVAYMVQRYNEFVIEITYIHPYMLDKWGLGGNVGIVHHHVRRQKALNIHDAIDDCTTLDNLTKQSRLYSVNLMSCPNVQDVKISSIL